MTDIDLGPVRMRVSIEFAPTTQTDPDMIRILAEISKNYEGFVVASMLLQLKQLVEEFERKKQGDTPST